MTPMKDSEIEAEVLTVIEDRIARNETTEPEWLTHGIVQGHDKIEGADLDFYLCCAYGHVRSIVRKVVQRYKPDKDQREADRQLLFPGFKRLQKAYLVDREGRQLIVPSPRMTDDECLAKAEELDAMAVGCREHADELRRYVDLRGDAATA